MSFRIRLHTQGDFSEVWEKNDVARRTIPTGCVKELTLFDGSMANGLTERAPRPKFGRCPVAAKLKWRQPKTAHALGAFLALRVLI